MYLSPDIIITFSIFVNVMLTLAIVFFGKKKKLKPVLLGTGIGLGVGMSVLLFGMTIALVATLFVNYPLQDILTALLAIDLICIPLGATLGLKRARS